MPKDPRQWLIQSDYDLETAEFMFNGGRYFYSVFMCHLAIEKALKGIYQRRFDEPPPKTHSLVYFVNKVELNPPETIGKFLVKIDQASVITRYPEDLSELQKNYTGPIVKELLLGTKEAIEWIKKIL